MSRHLLLVACVIGKRNCHCPHLLASATTAMGTVFAVAAFVFLFAACAAALVTFLLPLVLLVLLHLHGWRAWLGAQLFNEHACY